jgi:hypothetical protein
VSESAVRDKPFLFYGLARNRRSPKRPSEPRRSGAHPGGAEVEKRRRSLPFEIAGGFNYGGSWRGRAMLRVVSCHARVSDVFSGVREVQP